MSEDEAELRRLFRALARETGRRDPDEHPAIETLTAYQANELSPGDDRKIQEHLAVCEHCTELLLDLEEFYKPMPPDVPADFEAAADWKELRERISDVQRTEKPSTDVSYGQPKMTYLAAAFALIAVGSLVYALSLRERLNQPQLNTPIASLHVKSLTRGEAETEVSLPEGDEGSLIVSLVLEKLAEAKHAEYRLEILDSTGTVVWSKRGLLLSAGNSFDITLPRSFLTSDSYVLRVLGVEPGPEQLIGDYVLKLTKKPDSQLQ